MDKLEEIIINDNPKINILGRIPHLKIKILYAIAKYFNCKNYLEIGVHNGASMSYVLKSNCIRTCVGIDPFENLVTDDPYMVHYQEKDKITYLNTINNLKNNNINNCSIKLIQNYSENVNINNIDITFDLLFIDGNHSYNNVLKDYYKFKVLVKKGYIVFDDLHQEGPKKAFQNIINTDNEINLFGIYKNNIGILYKKN